jgi:hypothetical protein
MKLKTTIRRKLRVLRRWGSGKDSLRTSTRYQDGTWTVTAMYYSEQQAEHAAYLAEIANVSHPIKTIDLYRKGKKILTIRP